MNLFIQPYIDHLNEAGSVVLVKMVKGICSPLREYFSRAVIEKKKKLSFCQNLFFFHKLLLHKSMQYQGEEYSLIFKVSSIFSIKEEFG